MGQTKKWGSLKVFFNEVKANLQTVHFNIGGGAHDHQGIDLHPIPYDAIVPGIPYICPVFPGVFIIPPRATNIQAQMLHEAHQQSLQNFHEAEPIHNTILQQGIKDRTHVP